MKRLFVIMLLLAAAVAVSAQDTLSEWARYTSDAYYHDIEGAATKQAALDRARTNLARQVQVRVSEVSKMDKQAVNGRSNVRYSSTQSLSTDVDMDLAESRSYFSEADGLYYVIVFIDKAAACTYYENEVQMVIRQLDHLLTVADNYISTGFKKKAKTELEKAQPLFDNLRKPFFWLNVFALSEERLYGYMDIVHDREQDVSRLLADLEYGTTYCVVCEADLFGSRYAKLANEVKGVLAGQGCNFVDDPSAADYVIRISASARRYNTFQGAYFTYIDAAVSIDKTATGQRIFEDETSVKGSHTLGYEEAARDGYKKSAKEIAKLLKDNIKL